MGQPLQQPPEPQVEATEEIVPTWNFSRAASGVSGVAPRVSTEWRRNNKTCVIEADLPMSAQCPDGTFIEIALSCGRRISERGDDADGTYSTFRRDSFRMYDAEGRALVPDPERIAAVDSLCTMDMSRNDQEYLDGFKAMSLLLGRSDGDGTDELRHMLKTLEEVTEGERDELFKNRSKNAAQRKKGLRFDITEGMFAEVDAKGLGEKRVRSVSLIKRLEGDSRHQARKGWGVLSSKARQMHHAVAIEFESNPSFKRELKRATNEYLAARKAEGVDLKTLPRFFVGCRNPSVIVATHDRAQNAFEKAIGEGGLFGRRKYDAAAVQDVADEYAATIEHTLAILQNTRAGPEISQRIREIHAPPRESRPPRGQEEPGHRPPTAPSPTGPQRPASVTPISSGVSRFPSGR